MRNLLLLALVFVSVFPASAFARVPNDPQYDDLWYLPQVAAPEAWDMTVGSSDVVVAVLDTGFSFDHPDFAGNVWSNAREVAENGKDDDRNGFIDDVYGWDFVDDDHTPLPALADAVDKESQSHGSVVAGIIGAVGNNHEGVTGVVWNVQLMSLRILNAEGLGSTTDVANAIRYAVDNGADVINLSFVGYDEDDALAEAAAYAYAHNVVIVAALGNDATNVNISPVYPACLRDDAHDWVLGVTSTNTEDRESVFTNFGSDCADIAAPGEGIFGIGYTENTRPSESDLYIGPWEGTSTASPIVAGAVALLRSYYPDLSVDAVRSALKLSVDRVYTLSGTGALGAGRLNIARALTLAGTFAQTDVVPDVQEAPEYTDPVVEEIVQEDAFAGIDNSYVALGARAGNQPLVNVVRADGVAYASFLAFDAAFLGGVQVAVDDMNDDDRVEIVATPGVGGGPQVRMFTVSGALIKDFFAYDPSSRQGVSATIGDVTGDDVEEIVTAVGAGVSDDVVIFDQDGKELSRFTVTGFAPGTRYSVSVADVDDDWEKEIVLAAQNNEPRVVIYNADGTFLVDFLAYAPGMDAGLTLSSGDFDGDDRDEIVVGPLEGGAGHVRIFTYIGALWKEFFVSAVTDDGGTTVAVADIDIDGYWDIVTAPHGKAGDVQVWTPSGTLLGALADVVPAAGAWMSAW